MNVKTDSKTIESLMTRGVDEIIVNENLKQRLVSGEKLRIKFGVDPTAPDLHLGHTVPLRKLKQFQDAGHKAVLIIGDFTATIGDPSGRDETRKPLTAKDVKNNLKKYLKQAEKIIDLKKTEVFYNSKWFSAAKNANTIIELSMASTIQQVLHRADFQKRLKEDNDITLIEILYPLFQGYDSVMVKADVEIGGTDQKFNLLMGRRIQRFYKQKEQDILTVPIIEGLDGVRKMSKSYGNYIALDEEPENMFGKTMALPDGLITKYFELCTDVSMVDVEKIKKDIESAKTNPRDLKMQLAYEIVKIYHGAKKADMARQNFIDTFQKKEIPAEIPSIKTAKGITLSEVLIVNKTVKSNSEFRRLVLGGGIQNLESKEKITDPYFKINSPLILKIGKKVFLKINI